MKNYFFYTENMTVGYDGRPLIRNIRIEVNRGEILTLIGPNGAGKSTILKSITRQLKMIGGRVYIQDKQLTQMSGKELAKRLAVVLTERLKPELMTCGDVVATGRYPYTGYLGILGEEDHRKVWEALTLVHAQELYDRDFTAISDGQRQRILLARAICQEPELIILDEPTSFLDVKHKLEFLTILKKLVRENNVAVIMSLHELDLAQKISDQVICVKGDRVSLFGTPEEIFTRDHINDLYDIQQGSYDEAFGGVEMPRTEGEPEVFVIAGGGSGIPVYRSLQRKEIPFAVGVLHKNDLDYALASHLAAEVIAEEAYEPVSEEACNRALEVMSRCSRVICCTETFGTMNMANKRLKEIAESQGKLDNYKG